MVEVTMLGNAGAVPLPERALTSCVLTLDGRSVLIDCGEGTQTAARKLGVNLMRVDVIAITHYHGDHVFGIPGLIQSLNLGERTRPLYITGPVRDGGSVRQEFAMLLALAGKTTFEIIPVETPAEGLVLHDILPDWPDMARLRAFPTDHRVVSCGYSFELGRRGRFFPEKAEALGVPKVLWKKLQNGENVEFSEKDGGIVCVRPEEVMGERRRGIKVAFSGDTRYCRTLAEGAKDADLLICESTYGTDDQAETAWEYGHMTFSQAGLTAKQAKAERLWLTHFSQRISDPSEFLDNARAFFPGAEAGFDGKSAVLEFRQY